MEQKDRDRKAEEERLRLSRAKEAVLIEQMKAWEKTTGTSKSIRLEVMPEGYGAAFAEFSSRGGRVRHPKRIWLPPARPTTIGPRQDALDESCMPVPEFVEPKGFHTFEDLEALRKQHKRKCDAIRLGIAKEWDAKFLKADCLRFGSEPEKRPPTHGWMFADPRDGQAYWFIEEKQNYMPPPSLEKLRRELVDDLYWATRGE